MKTQGFFKNERGSTMVLALTIMTLILLLGANYLNKTLTQYRTAKIYSQMISSKHLANNAIVDLMRQFSQNHYRNHYDADYLDRGEAILLGSGFTDVTITPDELNRSLYLDAEGLTGTDAEAPTQTQTLHSVVKFESDLVTHNVWIDNTLSCGTGARYEGFIMHVEQNLNLSGGNVFDVGSLIVEGNISPNGAPSTVTGDLYVLGTINNPSNLNVLGEIYTYVPAEQYPSIDFAYYATNYNKYYAGNTTLTFNSDGTWDDLPDGNTFTVPAAGAVIYVHNGTLRISGTVRGRVTVVNNQSAYVIGDLDYANGTHKASVEDSFALIVQNYVYFCAKDLNYHGVVVTQNQRIMGGYVESAPYTLRTKLTSEKGIFSMWGTRISAYSGSMGGGFVTRNYNFDPMLRQYPPPGLPEKPILATWNME